MDTVILDTEVYPNYFLLAFKSLKSGNSLKFELTEQTKFDVNSVRKILNGYELISFNGINFDMPLIALALADKDNATIFECCEDIIKRGMRVWHLVDKYGIFLPNYNHIDIMEVAKGKVGLKQYAGRLNATKLMNLPIAPGTILTREQMDQVASYCLDDLELTKIVYKDLLPQLTVRVDISDQYSLDVRSKSDAQIAEHVIKSELLKLGVVAVKPVITQTEFFYSKPDYIKFHDCLLNDLVNELELNPFTLKTTGKFNHPECFKETIRIGDTVYKLGAGGIHSQESNIAHYSTENIRIIDRDVDSYYPNIILNNRLFPEHLGLEFLTVYKKLVVDRLKAKRSGNKTVADVLKIVINGSFGKFGSPFSVLFSPQLLLQTTVTGQLSLLMLIEQLGLHGIKCVSANTDGVLMIVTKNLNAVYDQVIHDWELLTGFETSETVYSKYIGRDVNNYLAVLDNGFTAKAKGIFVTKPNLDKSPDSPIIYDAVVSHIIFDTDIDEYVTSCKDITKFLALRKVTGGAVSCDVDHGKVIRWYYSTDAYGKWITYKLNGNKVPKSDGAKVLMNLPDSLPDDIDYCFYINSANKLLTNLTTLDNVC